MIRRSIAAVVFVVGVCAAGTAAAEPIKLARHPDYHAGKIAFSYLGDIWLANEDGTGARPVTDLRSGPRTKRPETRGQR